MNKSVASNKPKENSLSTDRTFNPTFPHFITADIDYPITIAEINVTANPKLILISSLPSIGFWSVSTIGSRPTK